MMGIYYTALETMRQQNRQKYQDIYQETEIGPQQPAFEALPLEELSLKTAAVRFIHQSCAELRFDKAKEKQETESGTYLGISGSGGQIPYNMQMDIDRLTLAKAVERFIDSGIAQDAFDVYFCYLEMFVGSYGRSRRMIELLSEFENNGSSLLMKHRDHYSHSVYVFALGLAIYETNALYRTAYEAYYAGQLTDGQTAAHHFLQYWGLASLFHDIGYPFELPFEQVESYFEERQEKGQAGDRSQYPFLAYHGLEKYIRLDAETQKRLKALLGYKPQEPDSVPAKTTDDLFAYCLAEQLAQTYHFTKDSIQVLLASKPANPDRFGFFMDHAYFSATVLFQELNQCASDEYPLTRAHIDALTAILLHNSLYKFSVAFYKDSRLNQPFRMELHPLAYLLMLCDELQCWDRMAYGRNSRSQYHPMGCDFHFRDNGIQAQYIYDTEGKPKIAAFEQQYEQFQAGKRKRAPKLKAYSDMVRENAFQTDIERIVWLNQPGTLSLAVTVGLAPADRSRKHTYLSNSNFIHLYHFAVALNAQYASLAEDSTEAIRAFEALSLEYKISNILQAKKFAEYMNELGCFYTDRPVDFDMKTAFTEDELVKIGILEHQRWEQEKLSMGWSKAGDIRAAYRDNTSVREQLRMHHLIGTAFETLPREEQVKDQKPLNTMMQKLLEFDGLRIYQLN